MDKEKVLNIEELVQDSHNFNKGTEGGAKLMERSLKELGACRSILIDKNGNIIAGNKTQEAAIKAGIKKVRVIETTGDELVAVKRTDVDINSAEGRKMAFIDNLATQVNLTWDETELKSVQDDVAGFDIADFGFDIEDLPQVTFPTGEKQGDGEGKPQTEVKEDDFDPDAHYETKVKAGEVWQLGEHRLMCGDSTDADAVAKLMNGERADLWLTDPPYNVEIVGGSHIYSPSERKKQGKLTIQNDKMSDDKFVQFLTSAFNAAFNVLNDGASFYIWSADKTFYQFLQALDNAKAKMRQIFIWNKNQFIFGRSDYHPKHEPCIYGWKEGSHNWYGDRKQSTVFDFDKPQRSDEHPTMKPIGLFGYQMQNSSKEGDIILDSFGGSGTTMIACEQLGRKCRMMELDPHYCTVIIARWEKLTGQKAVKLNP